MVKIVFAPDWFLGSDVTIELISFLVLTAFFVLAYKNYKLSKNKNLLYLGSGFLLIALAELATILTKLVLYYDVAFSQQIGSMIVTYNVVKSVDIFYYIGFFFHKLLTLFGLYVIYRTPLKKEFSSDLIFAVCFLVISAIFGTTFYYLFHFTAFLLVVFIINNYYQVYKKNRAETTKILILSFAMLLLSHIIFLISNLAIFYVFGQVIQLVSYLILLFLIIRILRASKKKRR